MSEVQPPHSPAEILDAALALPPDERAHVADLLLDSLETAIDPQVARAIADEAERRIDRLERGETEAISQEEFLALRRAKWNR